MDQQIINEANRLKQLAGKKLEQQLNLKFMELKKQGFIKEFNGRTNFSHTGYTYQNQYKTNFILETLDNKFIIINSSNSYRQDRVKQDLYDFQGIMNHADIANKIIASILLYPDEEINNTALISYRQMVKNSIAHSNATHIFIFSELIQFLENHKLSVELQQENEQENINNTVKDGSYFGLRGNAFEKEVVAIINNYKNLQKLKENLPTDNIYKQVISKVSFDHKIIISDIISISASNTVLKLNGGGNAKTDLIITIKTVHREITETVSIKNTTKNSVSCHDYRADDFIRVLGISNTKLAEYFYYYQKFGSHVKFVKGLPSGYTDVEFTKLLHPYKKNLVEWALTGNHDNHNLINQKLQTSNYLLINKPGYVNHMRFIDFSSYVIEMYQKRKLVYGIPLGWTHPSKQCGSRIQLKLPIYL